MSFATGFVKGFGDTLKEGIEENTERMNALLDQGISNAKAAAPGYRETQGELKSILQIGDSLKRDYNITDEEFVALAQATDITNVYAGILKEAEIRKTRGGKIRKSDILSAINIPDNALPESMSREQAIAQMLGLQGASLAEEDDPNSEGAQTRSLGKGLARMLALNPKLTAEERLKTMKVMGVDVSDLQYYMSTQGVKQTVVPGVTRTRDIMFEDLDYDKDSYAATQRKYNSMIATRLAGADISQQEVFTSVEGLKIEDKTAMRASALNASMSMAKLELALVNSGSSFGLIGLAARRDLLDGIYNSLDGGNDGVEEIAKLMQNISNGKSMEVIMSIYNSKGSFTKEDYQSIIDGVIPEGIADNINDTAVSKTVTKQDDDLSPLPLDEKIEVTELPPLNDAPIKKDLKEKTVVDTLIDNEDKTQEVTSAVPDNIIEYPDAGSRARETLDNKESLREAMADYTKDEWKSMSRSERKEAGLPVRGIDLAFAGGDAFKGAPKEDKVEEKQPSTASFLMDNQVDILRYLEANGLSGEETEEDFKLAIADWFSDNSNRPEIVASAGSTDLDQLAKIFKIATQYDTADKNNPAIPGAR